MRMVYRRNRFKTIIVTGVPGVGKTTVLKKLLERAKEKGIDLLILNFGDYMLKAAEKRGVAYDRDELRRLEHRLQLDLQKDAAKMIVEDASSTLSDNGILIVDTHSIIKTSSGYWPGLPEHVVTELNPDSIVLIEAETSEILERQAGDSTRYRSDVARADVIAELMAMARVAAVASATLTASSVFIVKNPQNRIMEPVEKLLELFEKL